MIAGIYSSFLPFPSPGRKEMKMVTRLPTMISGEMIEKIFCPIESEKISRKYPRTRPIRAKKKARRFPDEENIWLIIIF
jgi:hypothetical protein